MTSDQKKTAADVQRCRAEGLSWSRTARQTGISVSQARRLASLDLGDPPAPQALSANTERTFHVEQAKPRGVLGTLKGMVFPSELDKRRAAQRLILICRLMDKQVPRDIRVLDDLRVTGPLAMRAVREAMIEARADIGDAAQVEQFVDAHFEAG